MLCKYSKLNCNRTPSRMGGEGHELHRGLHIHLAAVVQGDALWVALELVGQGAGHGVARHNDAVPAQ